MQIKQCNTQMWSWWIQEQRVACAHKQMHDNMDRSINAAMPKPSPNSCTRNACARTCTPYVHICAYERTHGPSWDCQTKQNETKRNKPKMQTCCNQTCQWKQRLRHSNEHRKIIHNMKRAAQNSSKTELEQHKNHKHKQQANKTTQNRKQKASNTKVANYASSTLIHINHQKTHTHTHTHAQKNKTTKQNATENKALQDQWQQKQHIERNRWLAKWKRKSKRRTPRRRARKRRTRHEHGASHRHRVVGKWQSEGKNRNKNENKKVKKKAKKNENDAKRWPNTHGHMHEHPNASTLQTLALDCNTLQSDHIQDSGLIVFFKSMVAQVKRQNDDKNNTNVRTCLIAISWSKPHQTRAAQKSLTLLPQHQAVSISKNPRAQNTNTLSLKERNLEHMPQTNLWGSTAEQMHTSTKRQTHTWRKTTSMQNTTTNAEQHKT